MRRARQPVSPRIRYDCSWLNVRNVRAEARRGGLRGEALAISNHLERGVADLEEAGAWAPDDPRHPIAQLVAQVADALRRYSSCAIAMSR